MAERTALGSSLRKAREGMEEREEWEPACFQLSTAVSPSLQTPQSRGRARAGRAEGREEGGRAEISIAPRRSPAGHLPSDREMTARAKASSARARRSMAGAVGDAGRRGSALLGSALLCPALLLLCSALLCSALLVPAAAALCWRPLRPSRYTGAGGGGRRARGSS